MTAPCISEKLLPRLYAPLQCPPLHSWLTSPAAPGNPAVSEVPKEEEMGIIGLLITIVVIILLLRLIA